MASSTKINSVAVSDTSTNIATNISSLVTNIGKISSIAVTNGTVQSPASISMTSAQLTSLGSKLTGNYGVALSNPVTATQVASTLASNSKITSVAVSDSASGITTNLASLVSNASKISGIAVTGGTAQNPVSLTMTGAQLTAIGSKLTGDYSVSLSGAVTAAQVASTLAGNSKITSVAVSDSASGIAANFDSLHTNLVKITSISQSDPVNSISITASQSIAKSDVIDKLGINAKINVLDTVKNLFSNLYSLYQSFSSRSNYSMTATNPQSSSLTQSEFNPAQFDSEDFSSIGAINNFFGKITNISDQAITVTGINIRTVNPGGLNQSDGPAISLINKVRKVLLAPDNHWFDNTPSTNHLPSWSYNDFLNIATSFSKVYASDGTTHAVMEVKEAPSLSAAISIMGNSGVDFIDLVRSVTAATVSYQDYSDTNFQNKILNHLENGFQLTVSGVPANQVATLIGNGKITGMTVTDSATNIANNFGSLHTNLAKISAITQSDPNQSIALTASKVINDADVISKLGANAKIDLRDTLRNIVGNVYATYQVIGSRQGASITATDVQNSPVVTESDMNMSQYTDVGFSDMTALNSYLSKFTNAPDGSLTITGVTLFPDPDPSHSTWTNSWAHAFANIDKVGKVVLASNNHWRSGASSGNSIPGEFYSSWTDGFSGNLIKVFGSDGVTHATTFISGVPSMNEAIIIMGNSQITGISLDGSITTAAVSYQTYTDSNFLKIKNTLSNNFLTVTGVPTGITITDSKVRNFSH